MSRKHLKRYVTEFAGRHNVRSLNTIEQMAVLTKGMQGRQLLSGLGGGKAWVASMAKRLKTIAPFKSKFLRNFELILMANDYDSQVRDFLSAQKRLWGRFVWRSQDRRHYSKAQVKVLVQGENVDSRLILLSKTTGEPLKFSISLLFKNDRIMGLDVNPGRWHLNFDTYDKIFGTHWQIWPNMQVAIDDDRNLSFSEWYREFLSRAVIDSNRQIPMPPQGQQSDLKLN